MFVSNGVLVKTPTASSSYFTSMPPMSSALWSAHYSQIFRSQLWVAVVVMKRARALARLPIPVYRRKSDDGRERDRKHPMARLLAAPNPAMSRFKLLEWTAATRDIFGWAVWYKLRERGTVAQLWPLHPRALSRRPDGLWDFDNGKLRLLGIKPTDLMHFRTFDPDLVEGGMSPLEPLRSTLENEHAARSATSSFWGRGARPGFILEHPAKLSIPAYDRLKDGFAKTYEGPANTGSTLILEEGMKANKLELTAEEAQYIETRKLNREEVCAAYDVPPPVVHILDRATFSNITEQMRSMYRDTMAVVTPDFEGVIETDLRAVEWPQDDVYAEFLMDEVMRGDFETRQTALNQASYMTLAEKRALENLPYIEGTDRIFLNTATMPLDAIDAQADAIVASTAERQRQLADAESDVPEPRGLPRDVANAVMGRIGWQRSIDQVDAGVLIRGLDARCAEIAIDALATSSTIDELKNALRAAVREAP